MFEGLLQLMHLLVILGIALKRDAVCKRALSVLPIGAEARVDGPMGSFTFHNNTARSAVSLAAGIEIAPFLRIRSHVAAERLRHPIFLIYVNRYLENAPFMDALWDLERANLRVPVCSCFHVRFNKLPGMEGRDRSMAPSVTSAGPPTMVQAACRTLSELGIDEDDIRTEEFAGY